MLLLEVTGWFNSKKINMFRSGSDQYLESKKSEREAARLEANQTSDSGKD